MSYYQYANSGRSLGRILHQLNDVLRIPNHVVSEVILSENSSLLLYGKIFAHYNWMTNDTPIFVFADEYTSFIKQQDRWIEEEFSKKRASELIEIFEED
jgi:hypothetical protein